MEGSTAPVDADQSWSGRVAEPAPRDLLRLVVVAGLVALVSSLGFAKLTESVLRADDLPTIDLTITEWSSDHRSDQLTAVLQPATHLADPAVIFAVVVVAVLVLCRRRQVLASGLVAASCVGSALLVQVVKAMVGRGRPAAAEQLVSVSGAAFPSGHAAGSVACYFALALVVLSTSEARRFGVPAVVLAGGLCALVGASRVYLGVHWASDVVAGWFLGAAWLASTVVVFALAGWLRRAG